MVKDEAQTAATILVLQLVATPPSGPVPRVLTPMWVTYEDQNFDMRPYGVTVYYEDQAETTPLTEIRLDVGEPRP